MDLTENINRRQKQRPKQWWIHFIVRGGSVPFKYKKVEFSQLKNNLFKVLPGPSTTKMTLK